MVSILLHYALCSFKHVQLGEDAFFHLFVSLFVWYAAFEEVKNLISPLDCTVDNKVRFKNKQIPPGVVFFEKGSSQTFALDCDEVSLGTLIQDWSRQLQFYSVCFLLITLVYFTFISYLDPDVDEMLQMKYFDVFHSCVVFVTFWLRD